MSMVPSGSTQDRGVGHCDPVDMGVWDPMSHCGENSSLINTGINWKETSKAHILKADLPGLRKEEVKVEVEDERVLQISGERCQEREEKTDTCHRMERSSGKFVRRLKLPDNANLEQLKASIEQGVPTVTVPKMEAN